MAHSHDQWHGDEACQHVLQRVSGPFLVASGQTALTASDPALPAWSILLNQLFHPLEVTQCATKEVLISVPRSGQSPLFSAACQATEPSLVFTFLHVGHG